MSRLNLIVLLVVFAVGTLFAADETFKLTTGQEVTGEVLTSSANEQGLQVKTGENDYTRIPWASFSQADLKKFAANPKMLPLVEPFIEESPEEKIKKTEVNIKQPERLARPAKQSLLGALTSSTLGVFILALLYAATIYAAYEVAIFRAQPVGLVCGLAAIPFLGVFSPIAFLCMPTRVKTATAPSDLTPAEAAEAAAADAAAAAAPDSVNPMQGGAEHPAGLHLAHEEKKASEHPEPVRYQRGQFTFNRRFIETKFSGFFGVVRRDADKDMVMVVKSVRGEHVGQRISRIAANDFHLEVHRAGATQEVMIPFVEIQEIIVKHKDAP